MQRDDIVVEVRDRTLARIGTITPQYLHMTAKVRHNNVGEWQLSLPGDHPMVPVLSEDGAGILVTLYGQPKFSGPVVQPTRKADRVNPDGTYTFQGFTDEVHLADARAFPDPAVADPGAQGRSNDTRTGPAETLLRAYVAANIGPDAPAARRAGHRAAVRLSGPDLGRGGEVTKAPRFQVLLELLHEIATLGNMAFTLVQEGDTLGFQVRPVRDRSDTVRLDIENGTITSEEIAKTPPSVTRVLVAGQGQGTDRLIVQRTSAEAAAAEASWGRVIETFVDQRNSETQVELEQSGDEKLIEGGFTAHNVKLVAADDTTMRYGIDWVEGDTVAVVVNGQEVTSVVTAAAWVVGPTSVTVGAAIGDVSGFDTQAGLAARVDDLDTRTGRIERTLEQGGEAEVRWGDILERPATFPPTIGDAADQAVAGDDPRLADARTPLAHKHSAADMDSGTLSRARGGTGVSAASLAALKEALGIPYAMAAGTVGSGANTGNVGAVIYWSGGATVTFPVGRFTQVPRISANMRTAASGHVHGAASVAAVTTTGFFVRHTSVGGPGDLPNYFADWIAVQMTEGNASG